MKKLKVMTLFGTRPEAIKMCPLAMELAKSPEIETVCCVTAQHRQMLDSVLDIFGVSPRFDLDIMEESQTLTSITTKALTGLDQVFREYRPGLVLVHGDTSTTFAGALAAFYHGITVGHVEAGLRTYDKYSPFPEEVNRTLVSDIASLHFCPTARNAEALRREGVTDGIFVTGNTVIDALKTTVSADYTFRTEPLRRLSYSERRIILLTAHRRENYGAAMEDIFSAVLELTRRYDDIEFVYPVHLNPAVRDAACRVLGGHPRIHLTEPLDVLEMHNLMARCHFVMTDSGGLQEEAPALGKPVLVLRRETERPEAIEAGTVKLAGVDREHIVSLASELLDSKRAYEAMARAINPYGDGHACKRIVGAILGKR